MLRKIGIILFISFMTVFISTAENIWYVTTWTKSPGRYTITNATQKSVLYVAAASNTTTFEDGALSFAINTSGGGTSLHLNSAVGVVDLRDIIIDIKGVRYPITKLSISNYAFKDCKSITEFYANNVTAIGSLAFSRSSCKNIHISGSATTLPNGFSYSNSTNRRGVFSDCTSLTNIVLDLPLTFIGEAAFINAKNLKGDLSNIVRKSVTEIGNGAFVDCPSLTGKVEVASLKTLGIKAFSGCGVQDVVLSCTDAFKSFSSGSASGGLAYGIFSPCNNLTNLEIHAVNFTSLGSNNLDAKTPLKRLVINSKSFTTINVESAYYGFSKLSTLKELFFGSTNMMSITGSSGSLSFTLQKLTFNGRAAQSVVDNLLKKVTVSSGDKNCIIYAQRGSSMEWASKTAPFIESELSANIPVNCFGVYRNDSRKAWLVHRPSPFEDHTVFSLQ